MARTDTAVEIDRFLGINDDAANSGRQGEAAAMSNFFITREGKLRKRNGVNRISRNGVTGKVLDVVEFATTTLATYSFFVLTETALWGYNLMTRSFAAVYNRPASGPGAVFEKDDRLYLIGTGDFVRFDRNLGRESVEPYIPTVNIGKNSSGTVFTPYEKPNRLTSTVREEFTTDDDATVYKMKYKNISDVSVTGMSLLPSYTVNSENGYITFAYTPAPGGRITVTYTTADLVGRDTAIKNAAGAVFFGGTGDGDLFVWNGTDNLRYYTEGGDVSYFPEDNCDNVGNGKIEDMVRYYGKMLVFTTDGIYSSVFEASPEGDISYPTTLINSDCRYLSSKVVTADNHPVFISMSKLKRVVSTSVLGEKNVETVSGRIERTLLSLGASDVFSVESRGEVWITATGSVIVWNTEQNVFYRLDGFNAAYVFDLAAGVRFIDSDGKLCVFTYGYSDIDGEGNETPVSAYCYLAGLDFGLPFSVKRLNDVYIETGKEETEGGEIAVVTGGAGDAATVSITAGGVCRKKLSGERFVSLDLMIRSEGEGESLTVRKTAVGATRLGGVKRG